MKIVAASTCALLLFAASAAHGQTSAPQIDDPEATIVSELVVRAPTPGPAWWRVSKGDSVVWILGMPAGPTPSNLSWDQAALKRRMTGAKGVLFPPRGTVTFGGKKGDIPFMRMLPGLRQFNGNVEKAMPAPLAARFARIRKGLRKPVSRYAMPSPLFAAMILNNDFYAHTGLQRMGSWSQVEGLAKTLGTPVTRPPMVTMGTFKMADIDLRRPEAEACFSAMMDSAEAPVERYRAAAAGWAAGDVALAVSAPRDPLAICENRLFNEGYTRKSIEIQTKAIVAALEKPGKTLALSPLRTLLATNGVLERLADQGYKVVDPAGMAAFD